MASFRYAARSAEAHHFVKIRRAQPSDAGAIAGIILPVFREGSTYTIDPDISDADAPAYWLSSDKDTFVAEDDGAIVPTAASLIGAHVPRDAVQLCRFNQ